MTLPLDRRPRVVIVDDDPHVLVALGRLLQASCDVVASLTSGHEAIQIVCKARPDVLVVDLMMPDVDGLEVCRTVKQVLPETNVIMITACDETYFQMKALQQGASAFISKLDADRTLEAAIRRLFAKAQGATSV